MFAKFCEVGIDIIEDRELAYELLNVKIRDRSFGR
jgi:hypothetical protein